MKASLSPHPNLTLDKYGFLLLSSYRTWNEVTPIFKIDLKLTLQIFKEN